MKDFDDKRSVHLLEFPAPSEEEINEILMSSIQVPDHGCLSPYRFICIRDKYLNDFSKVLEKAALFRKPEITTEELEKIKTLSTKAPLIIVVVASPKPSLTVPQIEQIITAGCAAHMIGIAAHFKGYGTYWRTGEHAYCKKVIEFLDLKPLESIIGFLYIGSIPENFKIKSRKKNLNLKEWQGIKSITSYKANIRKANSSDLEDILSLVNESFSTKDKNRSWTNESKIVSGDRTSYSELSNYLSNEIFTLIVATVDTQIVGSVVLKKETNYFELMMLAVDSKCQQYGIGKQILSYCEAIITNEFKFKKIKIHVVSERKELVDFYLRRGYLNCNESFPYPVDIVNTVPLTNNLRVETLEKELD